MTSPRAQSIIPQAGLTVLVWFVWLISNSVVMLGSALLGESPMSLVLYSFLIGGSLAYWVHKDSRTTGVSTGLDQVFFIFIGWPITFPLYILQARGFRSGSLLLLIFLGMYLLTLVPAFLIVMAITFGRAILSMG